MGLAQGRYDDAVYRMASEAEEEERRKERKSGTAGERKEVCKAGKRCCSAAAS